MTKVQSKNALLFDLANDGGPLREALVETIGEGTTAEAGLISPDDKTKLDGIAAGATANAADAALRDRATHTGEQAISTITGLAAALAGKATPADVAAALAGLVDSSPATLDTLNELAAALGDDPNFAVTVSTALGNRLRVDAAQGLSEPQQAQGRDNLGLGSAALAAKMSFGSVAEMLAAVEAYDAGTILQARTYLYEVVSTGEHLTTAGGVKLKVLPVAGYVWAEAWADTVTEASLVAAKNAVVAMRLATTTAQPVRAPLTFACASDVTVQNTFDISNGGYMLLGLNIDFKNATIRGVAGGNIDATNPVMRIQCAFSEIKCPLVDGGRIGSCLDLNNVWYSRVYCSRTQNFKDLGGVGVVAFGTKLSGQASNSITFAPYSLEVRPDTISDPTELTGVAFLIDAYDCSLVNPTFGAANRCFYLTENAAQVMVSNPHPWNNGSYGNPSLGVREDTIVIESHAGGKCYFTEGYYDNGKILDYGGRLHVTGFFFTLDSQVNFTDAYMVKVICIAATHNTAPRCYYDLEQGSIEYVDDSVNGYTWLGAPSSNPYPDTGLKATRTRAIRYRHNIIQADDNTPWETWWKLGGQIKTRWVSGTNNTRVEELVSADGSALIAYRMDALLGTYRVYTNGSGGYPVKFEFGDGAKYIKATATNIEYEADAGAHQFNDTLLIGPTAVLDAASGTQDGASFPTTGGAVISAAGKAAMRLRRRTSDGPILGWHRDTIDVGGVDVTASGSRYRFTASTWISGGAGSPEGNVAAPVGCLWSDTTGGKLYIKATGTGNVGWVVAGAQT